MSDENKKDELKPGEKRDTHTETTKPGQPEKKEVTDKHEEGPQKKD